MFVHTRGSVVEALTQYVYNANSSGTSPSPTSAQVVASLHTRLHAAVQAYGSDRLLREYRQSLGLPPLPPPPSPPSTPGGSNTNSTTRSAADKAARHARVVGAWVGGSIAVVGFVVLLGWLVHTRMRQVRQARRHLKELQGTAPGVGPRTTLLVTDIQVGSILI